MRLAFRTTPLPPDQLLREPRWGPLEHAGGGLSQRWRRVRRDSASGAGGRRGRGPDESHPPDAASLPPARPPPPARPCAGKPPCGVLCRAGGVKDRLDTSQVLRCQHTLLSVACGRGGGGAAGSSGGHLVSGTDEHGRVSRSLPQPLRDTHSMTPQQFKIVEIQSEDGKVRGVFLEKRLLFLESSRKQLSTVSLACGQRSSRPLTSKMHRTRPA